MTRGSLVLFLGLLAALLPSPAAEPAPLPEAEAERYARTVLEAIGVVREMYPEPLPPEWLIDWAVRGLYAGIDEPVPDGVEARLHDLDKLTDGERSEVLAEARLVLGRRAALADGNDVTVTLKRMLARLDPHSTYISPQEREPIICAPLGWFGIGVRLRQDPATKQIQVATPLLNGPAHRAGVQAGDLITAIVRYRPRDGKEVAFQDSTPTRNLPVASARELLLGSRLAPVKLVVQRAGVEKEIVVTREGYEVESVLGYHREAGTNAWNYWLDAANRIAYVRLTRFEATSDTVLERVLRNLKADKGGIEGLVLDLRSNPGGYLTVAVNITDLFIDDGKILTIRPRVGRPETYSGKSPNSFLDFPMVCLVDGETASSGEILAAALQDHRRATILGERSRGKGSVQHNERFEEGLLTVTVATFHRPDGRSLDRSRLPGRGDGWGVVPDRVVPATDRERADLRAAWSEAEVVLPAGRKPAKPTARDRRLEAALAVLRELR